jgi:hypothetical protein
VVGVFAAILALLAASTARGEAIEAVVEAPTQVAAAAAEAPAPPEPVQAAAEEAQAPAPAPVAEAPNAAAAAVTTATEPVQAPSPSLTAAPRRQVSKLVEDTGPDSAERIGRTAERLTAVPASPARALTNTVTHRADAAAKSFAGKPLLVTENFVRSALAQVGSTIVDDPLAPVSPSLQVVSAPGSSRALLTTPESVSFSPPGTIGWLPATSIAALGVIETVVVASRAAGHLPDRWGASPVSAPATSVSLPPAGGGRAGDPTPSDVPSPAPGSPGAVASGSGGPIFVPIAALLALLALAVPAALRRLGEAPEFRPPTPFALALERPG